MLHGQGGMCRWMVSLIKNCRQMRILICRQHEETAMHMEFCHITGRSFAVLTECREGVRQKLPPPPPCSVPELEVNVELPPESLSLFSIFRRVCVWYRNRSSGAPMRIEPSRT